MKWSKEVASFKRDGILFHNFATWYVKLLRTHGVVFTLGCSARGPPLKFYGLMGESKSYQYNQCFHLPYIYMLFIAMLTIQIDIFRRCGRYTVTICFRPIMRMYTQLLGLYSLRRKHLYIGKQCQYKLRVWLVACLVKQQQQTNNNNNKKNQSTKNNDDKIHPNENCLQSQSKPNS